MGKIIKEVERRMIDADLLDEYIKKVYAYADTYREKELVKVIFEFVRRNTIDGIYTEEED